MICETNLPSKIEPNRALTDLTLKETHLKTYPTMKAINIQCEHCQMQKSIKLLLLDASFS